jgi:hypothetical protein
MRRVLLFIGIIFLAVIISFDLKVSAQQKPPEKKYSVTLSLQNWIQITNELDYIKSQLRQSDLPSKQVAFMSDSLLTPLQTTIGQQVNAQIQQETKKDTVLPKRK